MLDEMLISSDNIRSLEVSNKIMTQARDYVSAVEASVQIAEKGTGYVLADAAIRLHDLIYVQFEPIDHSQLKAYLDMMTDMSNHCLDLALFVKEIFELVRSSLSQVFSYKLYVYTIILMIQSEKTCIEIESGGCSGSVNTLPPTPAQTIPDFSNEIDKNIAKLVDWWRCVSTALGTLANRECIDLKMSIISLRGQWLLAEKGYLQFQLRVSGFCCLSMLFVRCTHPSMNRSVLSKIAMRSSSRV